MIASGDTVPPPKGYPARPDGRGAGCPQGVVAVRERGEGPVFVRIPYPVVRGTLTAPRRSPWPLLASAVKRLGACLSRQHVGPPLIADLPVQSNLRAGSVSRGHCQMV